MSRVVTAGESATLSKELTDFLIEYSIGLHKNAIYPPGHPLLENTTADLSARLATLLRDRATLSLGVARHQLIIEGVATDEKNPVLRELANRLHKHHLGAVKFSAGVTEDELTDMLAKASVDAGRLPRPLGLEGPEVLTQWPHIRLFPLTFAQLQLIEEDPNASDADDDGLKATGSRAAALWVGLARAALVAQAEKLDADDPAGVDPSVVAQAIEEHKRDAAYDQVVVGYLLQIAEELKHKSGREAAALQRRISQLIAQLSPATLERLVRMGGNRKQQQKFVLDAAQGMALDAVIELVRAASESAGQNVSHSMVRMLSKLASHAESGPPPTRSQADGALRDQVKKLMEGWALEDPNPEGYRVALEKMARAEPVARAVAQRYPIEPERLLAMGLEIETLGEQVWHSADVLAQQADVAPLLNLVDNAPSLWMRDTLWRHVATPQRLRLQLALDPLPVATLERIVRRMGVAAVDPLLDAFEESTDDRRQNALTLLLERVGPAAGGEILTRLPGMRWSQLRPMLALLGRHAEWNCGFDATQWMDHPDAAVRRETLRQLLRAPQSRDAAIVRALADADEGNVRLGLGAAMTNCPRDAALMLRTRADEASLSADLRALGIRALSSDRATDTPTWLAGRVLRVGKLLKRETLASKSPEMLASIEGLAIHWRTHPAAAPVLALASASGDPEIAAAAAMTARSRADTPLASTLAMPTDAAEETP
jgi:histone H3/H4